MIRTIRLYGRLKKICGVDKVELHGETVAELIEGFSANFRELLKPRVDRPRMVCRIKGYDTEQSLYDPLNDDTKEIHLYPMLGGAGGGNGGLFKVILGVVLIAVAVVLAPFVLSVGGIGVSWALSKVGWALVIGGALQMLAPVPKVDTNAANDI